jgi:NSS family neurotransmitter:Na+ symporter
MSDVRDRWPSRLGFLFASLGSAAGLGNIWRFPYLTYKFGGGAFLLPYLVILFALGIPLLLLEFSLGQRMQRGAIGAFEGIDRRLGGIGLVAILVAFVITGYYSVVIGWTLLYSYFSLSQGWGADPGAFFEKVIAPVPPIEISGLNWPVVVATLLAWVLIYFSIWKGVQSVTRVVMLTVPLPVLFLLILLLRTATLEGALGGIALYLTPDFSALLDVELWIAAISQIFFTLSLGFGIMIAYASYQRERSEIVKNGLIIALSNSGISLLAGFVVFSTIGFMAAQAGEPVSQVATAVESGIGLSFVVFPEALNQIWGTELFGAFFFLTLLTLGIDSAFSLVEAVGTVASDRFGSVPRHQLSLLVCALGFLIGIPFMLDGGIYLLDIIDHFIVNYGLVVAGLLEILAVGWVFGPEKLRTFLNEVSEIRVPALFDPLIRYVAPFALVFLLATQLLKDLSEPYGGYPGWAVNLGWAAVAVPLLAGLLYSLCGGRQEGENRYRSKPL